MSTWRVAQHYGFGAARIPIHPEPHRSMHSGLRGGFLDVHHEFLEGGVRPMLRRTFAQSPAFALFFLVMAAFFFTLIRDHSDNSPIEVVFLEDRPLPTEVLPEPIPEPVPIAVEPAPPPPVPEPIERVEPKPAPPPEILAERPKPPPPPKAKPVAPKPPVMPQIARVEPKPPPAPVRPNRPDRLQPVPTAKPRIAVDAVAPRVAPSDRATPRRAERVAIAPQPNRPNAPRLDAPTAPRLAPPANVPPPRGFRTAAVPDSPRTRAPKVMPGLAPTPQSPAAPTLAATTRVRSEQPRPKNQSVRVAPALAAAPVNVPSAPVRGSAPVVRRGPRPIPQAEERHSPRPISGLAQAPVDVPRRSGTPTAARVARVTQAAPSRGATDARPGLAGVPLADLAVCISDREEDRLKQAVVAAVTTQKECVSRAGTYRFVETKNLNSFLMWIDRASGRVVGDRCDELRYALECLKGASQRAAR